MSGFESDDAPKAKHYDLEFQELTANVNSEDSVTEFEVDQKTIIHALTFNTARGSYLENQTVEGFSGPQLQYSHKDLVV
jgi:hypothetical protein